MPPKFALRSARGFTLIQLLVAIGILIVLMGLLVPAVLRSYKVANRTRTEADLHLIETALDAYHQDFGDYPRFDDDNTGLNLQPNRGALLLCRALLGPSPAAGPSPGAFGGDGADGLGFRIRAGTGGKVYGPYIQSDKFQIGGSDKQYFTDAFIEDRVGHAILYFPAKPGPPAITAPNGSYIAPIAPAGNGVALTANRPLYNAIDNTVLPLAELQFILGDRNNSGVIDPGETPTTTAPYLLWCAGEDGIYGRSASLAGKTDDVTNFDLPTDIRK